MIAKVNKLPKPLQDYVLGRMIRANETQGGIAIPDGSNVEDFNRMEVIDVGPGRIGVHGGRDPIDVEVGDTVLCIIRDAHQIPIQFECDGAIYTLITNRELIATVEG